MGGIEQELFRVTLEIALRPDEEARLREVAAMSGQDLQTYVREAALEKASRPTLMELLAPVHEDTQSRAISIEQTDDAIDRARNGLHREQTARALDCA